MILQKKANYIFHMLSLILDVSMHLYVTLKPFHQMSKFKMLRKGLNVALEYAE